MPELSRFFGIIVMMFYMIIHRRISMHAMGRKTRSSPSSLSL